MKPLFAAMLIVFTGAAALAAEKADKPAPPAKPVVSKITDPGATFMEAFPQLAPMIYREPHSGYYLGFGASPLGILNSRQMFTAGFFQVHYISQRWDLELLSASLGFVHSQSTSYSSTNFIFRTAPKLRIGDVFSFGPLFGWEWVSFPNIQNKLYKAPYVTPAEPFSSDGPIYGAMATETFHWGESYLVQFNQLVFQETYITDKTREGWTHLFINNPELTNDRGPVAPSLVIMLEVSFLY